jgi:hypothetical protein
MAWFQTWSLPEEHQFVVEIGAMSPLLLQSEQWRRQLPKPGRLPSTHSTQFTWRLEAGWIETAGYNVEQWWSITAATTDAELDALAVQVVDAIAQRGMQLIAGLDTDEGIRDYLIGRMNDPDGLFSPWDRDALMFLLEVMGQEEDMPSTRIQAAEAIERAAAHRAAFMARFSSLPDEVADKVVARKVGEPHS